MAAGRLLSVWFDLSPANWCSIKQHSYARQDFCARARSSSSEHPYGKNKNKKINMIQHINPSPECCSCVKI